ncbi:propionyl-coenzyme A carboxylase alpha polypeptide [Mesorhizobium sp. B2-3-6]|nr:propionyl-coenzyme A carboxylase alpha polypeptide [Mesorhizobium sp. B2-4-10]TPM15943.1 propionyl-coenzyme A carboxylase alpha polypeptide [Mesorhizobium sp. B2-3-6]
MRSFTPPSGLPAISPTGGEIGSFGAGPNFPGSKFSEAAGDIQPPLLVGEMADRPEGGVKEREFDFDG